MLSHELSFFPGLGGAIAGGPSPACALALALSLLRFAAAAMALCLAADTLGWLLMDGPGICPLLCASRPTQPTILSQLLAIAAAAENMADAA